MARPVLYSSTKKRRSPAQFAHLKRLNEKENIPPGTPTPLPRQPAKRAKVLQDLLSETQRKLVLTECTLSTALASAESTASKQAARADRAWKLLRNERRKVERAKRSLETTARVANELKRSLQTRSEEVAAALDERTHAESQHHAIVSDMAHQSYGLRAALHRIENENEHLHDTLRDSRKRVRALEMRCRRQTERNLKLILAQHNKDKGPIWRLMNKGVYTAEARGLARFLVQSGCSQKKVGEVIKRLARIAGASSKRSMSSRTVGRALMEGGVASRIQLGYEITCAKGDRVTISDEQSQFTLIQESTGFTIGGDGTTHRKVTYESRVLELSAPSYTDPSSDDAATMPTNHKTRVLSVKSAVDHTSETQLAGWLDEFQELFTTFNASPFAHRTGSSLEFSDFARKLKEFHSDHSNDQKKLFRLWQEWKTKKITTSYGFEQIERRRDQAPEELAALLQFSLSQTIKAAGGPSAWQAFDVEAQRPHLTKMLEDLAIMLGAEVVALLPSEEKREVEMFFWAGCSMHKELNSVKGGNAAMMKWWTANNVTAPILLANKDNDAALKLTEMVKGSEEVVKRALEVSSRGGVKAASLAGAIFNHKDDKKGQQDMHLLYFQNVKGVAAFRRFPDTSNTRYHSHCDAASELLTDLPHYVDFLDFIRLNKEHPQLNHMEGNLLRALRDPATLTELAVLTLYGQAITKPYMMRVRAPGTEGINVLTLGPLHEQLKYHIWSLIVNPDIIFCQDTEAQTMATFDGVEWENPDAVAAVHRLNLEGSLPYLREVFVAFLSGALDTWQKFTSEFTPGSLIASSTDEEKALAFMPTTNDANEGMLGMWRRHSRTKSSLSVCHFSDQAAFFRNDTQDFMDAKFVDEDHQHLRKVAREIDTSGIEQKTRNALIQHGLRVAEVARKNETEKAAKKQKQDEHYGSLVVVTGRDTLRQMSNDMLKDQLELHRRLGIDKEIPMKSRLTNKEMRFNALLAVVERFEAREHAAELLTSTTPAPLVPADVGMEEFDHSDIEY